VKEKLTKKNQSVDKMFQIIEVLAGSKGSMRLQDISKAVQYPASTVLRMLNTLVELGYAYQISETSKYSLSLKFCEIGESVYSQFNLREFIHPYLQELSERCQEAACFAIEQDMMAVYLDAVEGPDKILKTLQRIGKSAPMHSTGVGKLMLLNYSDTKLAELVRQKGLIRLTDKTFTDIDSLKEELEKIRDQGYAYDNEECELGVRCIAAPIRDYTGRVKAGISVSGSTGRITLEKAELIINIITEISARVSKKLGYKAV
jgi:Transcriptional regulator